MSQSPAQASSPTYRLSERYSIRGEAQRNSIAVHGLSTTRAGVEDDTIKLEKKLRKRRKAITPLLEAAHELGDQETIDTLSSARDERNAMVQKTLIVKAAKRINLLNAALVDRPDIANSAQPPPAPAPPLPIAGKKRKSDSPADVVGKRLTLA
ncbi:hypothetical protein JCM5353_005097 [Sporobolomyces roseus]